MRVGTVVAGVIYTLASDTPVLLGAANTVILVTFNFREV